MKKTSNESYNRIIEYIKSSPNIEEETKRILFSYATQLYIHNVENKETESLDEMLNDIKRLNEVLKVSNDTTIVAKRLEDEINIFEMIRCHYQTGENNIEKISFELDRLYLETDLGLRQNSSLSYNLKKNNTERRTK